MYKVFLVEDEIVIREGIKNLVHWEEQGVEIVGDESDGELAYPKIIKAQPDILITDIKMPFMDGLELSKLIKKELPQLKIIIISGYSEFDYAQQAIDIGVNEYLLKPITSTKLMTAVRHVTAAIEKERKEKQMLEQYELLVYQKQREKRKDFFDALVSGKLSLAQIMEQEAELGINMVASVYCIVLFEFKPQDDLYEYSGQIVQCESKMFQELRNFQNLRVFECGMDGYAFVLLGEEETQIQKLIADMSKRLIQICEGQVHYFGGIGRCVYRVRDLHQSYLDANQAFSLRYFENRDQFLSYQEVHGSREQIGNRINVSELNLEKLDRNLLMDFLKRGTIHDVEEFVDSYFEGLGTGTMSSGIFRQYVIMDGYTAILKFLKTIQYPKENVSRRLKSLNCVTCQPLSLKDCREFYKSILKETIDLRNQSSQKRYAGLMEQAKDYMHQNFAMSDLTLDKVAAAVNISPNYFSSLFNQEAGMTFIEYLTELRMQKAKDYLRCSNKKITEIGSLVGYLDSHYFSYIFKKTQNCTPSEYRLQG